MVWRSVDWEGVAIFLLAIGLYVNTLGHGFVYDDNRAVLTNADVLPSSPLFNIFLNDFWGTPLSSSNSHGSYRPLCVISFRLNHLVAGFNPFSFHLTNVLLHAVASTLVLTIARLILPGRSPVLAAALFAVHPVHVEAVAGIVGRADVLASIFFLISFLFYTKHIEVRDRSVCVEPKISQVSVKYKVTKKNPVSRRKFQLHSIFSKQFFKIKSLPNYGFVYFCLYLVFAICAVLSKEPGLTIIPLAICYDIILHLRSKKIVKNSLVAASASASVVSFVLILLLRLIVMGISTPSFSRADNPTAKENSLLTRSLTFFYLPVFNFWLLICPNHLSFDWSMDAIPRVSSVIDPRFLFTVVFFYCFYRTLCLPLTSLKASVSTATLKAQNCSVCKYSSTNDHLSSCRILNNNNLPQQCHCSKRSPPPLSKGAAATMCLAFTILPFLPATNLFFYVGFVVAERVLYIPSIGLCLLVALGMHTLWSTRRSLVLIACLLLVTILAARTLRRNRDWFSEESLYRSATHINPAKAYGNLGSILSSAGRLDEAEAALRLALDHRPNMADVHYNLGNLLARRHNYEGAFTSYQLAIKFRPSLAVAYSNMGQVLEYLDQKQEAEVVYQKCLRLDVSGLKDPKAHKEAQVSCHNLLASLCKNWNCSKNSLEEIHNTKALQSSQLKSSNGVLKISEANLETVPRTVAQTSGEQLRIGNKTNRTEMEDMFLRAVRQDPENPAVYVQYGTLLVESGKLAKAATLFVRAAQLAPHQHTLVTSAAIALRHAGRLEESEELYRKARDLRPKDATSYSNLGAILHMQGKYREAAVNYKEALRLLPGDHVTLTNLNKLKNLLLRNKR